MTVSPKACWPGFNASPTYITTAKSPPNTQCQIPYQPEQGLDGYGGKDFGIRKVLGRERKTP